MNTRVVVSLTVAAVLLSPCAALAARPAKPAAVTKSKPAQPRKATPPGRTPATGKTAAPAAALAPGNRTWALLVGVSKYQNPLIVSLRFPASDATAIRDALVDPQLGGLPAGNVRLLTDDQATTANIFGAVDGFLKPNVKPGDQVILFLAGHGVAKGVGLEAKSFFLSTNIRGITTPMLEASAVDLKLLSEKLSELPAAKFAVFVDACREDPTPGRALKGNMMSDVMSRGLQIVPRGPGHPAEAATFFACSIGQRAFEDPSLQHGVFTYWILDGIRHADIPKRPDGAVDLGLLASYVTGRVAGWAKSASAKGDFEVEQTPELVTDGELSEPIVLVHVRRPLPATPISAVPPTLTVVTEPAGGLVTLDGERVGTAPVRKSLPRGGRYTLRVETPGCAPVERPITALDGYGMEVTVTLPPGPRSAAAPASQEASDLYSRAQEAEERQQWEVAEAGYDAAVKADPQFELSYERLAELRLQRGKTGAAIGTLIELANQMPSLRAYSLLSRAYSLLAVRQGGSDPGQAANVEPKRKKGGLFGSVLGKIGGRKQEKQKEPAGYVIPPDAPTAAALALRAAGEAVKRDPAAADAQSALGFALIATDSDGKNKDEALAAFGKAVLMEPQNAAHHYGMGYAIRTYAQRIKEEAARKSELQRAVAALKQALELRPHYYEAHRELAFCYHLLDDLPAAQREYEQANANRGAATDENEIAAVNLSMAGIDRQQAQSANGEQKQNLLAASDGYLSDAREINPNLQIALRILNQAGVSTRVADYLPAELRQFLDLPGALERGIKGRIPSLPGLP